MNHSFLTALLLIVSLAALPAAADSETYDACDNTSGLPTVTVAEGAQADIDTPIGSGVPLVTTVKVQTVDGGDYLVDLDGEEIGTRKTVSVDLTWTNGINDELTDYDMVVDGTVYQDTSNPESARITAGHCQIISVDEVYTYTGTPADSLSLSLRISSFGF